MKSLSTLFTASLLFLFLFAFVNTKISVAQSGEYVQLGSGTLTTDNNEASPINISHQSIRAQWVYTTAEISDSGIPRLITEFGLFVNTAPVYELPGFTIRMRHTSAPDASEHDNEPSFVVYQSESYTPQAGDYDMLELTRPFFWNGEDNILVEVCFDPVEASSNSGTIRYYSETNGFRYVRNNTGACDLLTNSSSSSKPQAQIQLSDINENDAGFTALVNPEMPFNPGVSEVKAVLFNFGSADLESAQLNWQVNGQEQTAVNWTGTLATNAMVEVELGTFNFEFDDTYDIEAWTSLPNGVEDELFSNDSISASGLIPAMSGIYTVGGSTPDFNTSQEAADQLATRGVTGEVTINIRPGIYNENFIIDPILGSSAQNHITFKSETGNREDVEITFDSGSDDNYLVRINRASFLRFSDITFTATNSTYSRIFRIGAHSEDIRIENNDLISPASTSTYWATRRALVFSEAGNQNNITISQNNFAGGSYGIYISAASDARSNNISIEDNIFQDQWYRGVNINHNEGFIIQKNAFASEGTSYYAIHLDNAVGNKHILSNRINVLAGNYGIYSQRSTATADNRALIANNFIHLGGNSTAHGISMNWSVSHYDIYHNNILITGADVTNGRALSATSSNNSDLNIKNNNFVNTGGGYTLYLGTTNGLEIDHNNYLSTGPDMARLNNNYAVDLAEWQTITSQDVSSLSLDPVFLSEVELYANRFELVGAGVHVGIDEDIDGASRDLVTPVIGANELTPPENDAGILALNQPSIPFSAGNNAINVRLRNNGSSALSSVSIECEINGVSQTAFDWTGTLSPGHETDVNIGSFDFDINASYHFKIWSSLPNGEEDTFNLNDTLLVDDIYVGLGGLYTVGGSNPDFEDITQAFTNLNIGGITGETTFSLRSGSYNEQLQIIGYPGNDSDHIVFIESETGNNEDVTITYNSSEWNQNYTLFLNGPKNLVFRNLTFAATNTSRSRIIELDGVENILFEGNVFNTSGSAGNSTNRSSIYAGNYWHADVKIIDNVFNDNNYGVYLYSSTNTTGTEIRENIFNNQSRNAIYLRDQIEPRVTGNEISTTSATTSFSGIELRNSASGFVISENTITANNGNYGMYLRNANGNETERGWLFNNFVHIHSSSGSSGIFNSGSSYLNVFFNNVNVTGSSETSRAFYTSGGSNISVLNNIFSNQADGHTVYINSAASVSTIDHNNYFTTGENLGYWDNADVANFDDWQISSGEDANSWNVDPLFVSDSDLHVRQVALNGQGTPIDGITTDIDGEDRDAANPDMGADEFPVPENDAGLLAFTSPEVPFSVGENPVGVTLVNNGGNTISSVEIHWEVNDEVQNLLEWTGTLEPGDETEVVLGNFVFNAGTFFDIAAWSQMPNGVEDEVNFNDTISIEGLTPALSGEYTIGGDAPDFQDFTGAIDAMNASGVLGAVDFLVRPGTYEEQLVFGLIDGVSEDRRVTFRSESGDSTDVIIAFDASYTANYTVSFDAAEYISLQSLTLEALNSSRSRLIEVGEGTAHIHLLNNYLKGYDTNNSSTNRAIIYGSSDAFSDIVIENNYFENGSYGVYLSASWNSYQGPLEISNNDFKDQYAGGLYLNYVDSPYVFGNDISTIKDLSSYTGIYARARNGSKIMSNSIDANNGYRGIMADFSGSDDNKELIANNFVHIGGNSNNTYGIFLSSSTHTNVYHNNVHLTTDNTGSRAFYAASGNNIRVLNNIFAHSGSGFGYYTSTATNIINSDHNNIYAPNGILGYWNNTSANTLDGWQSLSGFDSNSLSIDPIFASDTDLHINQIGLHQTGFFVGITHDIDGNDRNTVSPDIGADEFTPTTLDVAMVSVDEPEMPFASGENDILVTFKNNGSEVLNSVFLIWSINGEAQANHQWEGSLSAGEYTQVNVGSYDFQLGTPYEIVVRSSTPNGQSDQIAINDTTKVDNLYAAFEGHFTIGGENPDFESFSDAVDVLNVGGVTGPTTFNVRNGEYTEQLQIGLYPGASHENLVVFQSESGEAEDVTLNFNASYGDNYTVQFSEAKHMSFKKLTLQSLNTSYMRVIDFSGSASDITLENNIIRGALTTSTQSTRALIYSNNETFSDLIITGNNIDSGSYAIYLSGSGNREGVLIQNNIISGQYRYGIYLNNTTAPRILGNVITSQNTHGSYSSIYVRSSPGATEISQNKISDQTSGRGIHLSSCDAGSERGLLSNNFVQIGTEGSGEGIYFSSVSNFDVVYNTVNHTANTSADNYAASFNWSQGLNLKNNIFAATQGAQSIYFNSTSTTYAFESDHNNLYSTGNILGFYGGDIADLTSWQNQTNNDANSLSADPLFESETDLYINQNALVGSGISFAGVIVDIDNNTRDPQNPVIGAHELTTATFDAAITSIISPAVPFAEGVNEVVVTLLNNAVDDLTQVTINWEVNGLEQAPYDWTGTLSPGATEEIVLGDFNFLSGQAYTITASSSEPNGEEDQRPQNDTSTIDDLYAGLNGSYSIGGDLADFENFSQAIKALDVGGVADSVLFLVNDGTYTEQLELQTIAGASAENTITFRSESTLASAVVLEFDASSADNYTLKLQDASHVYFEHLTFKALNSSYGRTVDLSGDLSDIAFRHSAFSGIHGTSTTQNRALVYGNVSALSHVNFYENSFFDGSYAILISGNSNPDDESLIIEENAFRDQYLYGVHLSNITAPSVRANVFTSPESHGNFTGIYFSNCNEGTGIYGNRIFNFGGGYGMQINGSSSSLTRGNIVNNFVQSGGTGNAYGIYLSSSSRFNVYHNTINVTGTHTTSGRAFYITSGANNVLRNNIFANTGDGYAIYVNNASSISSSDFNNLYASGSVLSYWDNGNVNDFEDWKSTSGQDGNSLNLNPGFIDDFSVSVSDASLSTAGINLPGITEDINGNQRNASNPSTGALEFLPLNQYDVALTGLHAPQIPFAVGEQEVVITIRNNGSEELTSLTVQWVVNGTAQQEYEWQGNLQTGQEENVIIGTYEFQPATAHTLNIQLVQPNGEADEDTSNNETEVENFYAALEGHYTIGGGSGGDFPSFAQAVDNLNNSGILGDVDFSVVAGSYYNQLHFTSYPGMHPDHRVSFRSENQDSTQVVLHYNASSSAENYTVLLDGASQITFENITIEAQNNNNARVVQLANNARNNTFKGNIIKGVPSPNTSLNRALIFSGSSSDNNITIENNLLLNGSAGINLDGGNQTGVQLKNNILQNQYSRGIYLRNQNQPLVEGNEISSESTYHSYVGITLSGISNGAGVSANKIKASGSTGISVTSGSGTSSSRFLLANNFIHVGGDNAANGLYLRNTSFVNIYFNSINITSSHSDSRALYSTGGQNINLINNILSNKTGGYSVYVNTPSAISSSNHNNFYYTGLVLGYWNSARSDLTQWQEATGNDAASLSVDPLFYSEADLHISQPHLFGTGLALSAVTLDIDGELRDATNPTIGADEFEPHANDVGPVAMVSPLSDCELGSQEQVIVRVQNMGTEPQSDFEVSFVLNGEVFTENFGSTAVQPFETMDFAFDESVDLSQKGDYSFTFATNLQGDENHANDSLFNRIVSHHSPPVTQITEDKSVCVGESVVLAADGGDSYLWSTGEETAFIEAAPMESTTYTVTVFNQEGCSTEASVFVETREAPQTPVVSISGDLEFCQGESVVLSSDIEDNIVWSTGSTESSIEVFQSGVYTVTHSNEFDCYSESDAVEVNLFPAPTLTPSIPESLCPDTELTLTVSHGESFAWQSGENTRSIQVTPQESTQYVVVVEDGFGCSYELNYFAEVLELETPEPVSNMVPASESVDLSLPVSFSWAPGNHTDEFDLYVWPEGEIAPEDPVVANITTLNRNYSGSLTYGKSFQWRIDSRNSCKSTQGPVQTFTLRELPDLIVENVSVPEIAFAGETLDISYEVKNTGQGATGAQPWKDGVFVSFNPEFDNTAIRVAEFNNQSYLNPGQSYVQNFSVEIPGTIMGEYYVFVKANNRNKVLEVSDANNTARNTGSEGIPFVLPPMANLEPLTLNVGEIAFSGDEVNTTYSAVNNGDKEAAGVSTLRGVFGYDPLNYINHYSLPTCAFTERVWVDGIYISEDPFYESLDAIKLEDNIVRIRSEKYEGQYFCDYMGAWLNTPDFLEVDEEYTRVVPVEIPHQISGTYYIHVVLNYGSAFDEFNRNNNVITSQPIDIVMRPPPDLVVESVNVDAEMVASESYNIEWTVKNQGANAPIEKSWRDAIYLSTSETLDETAIYLDQRGISRGDTLSSASTYTESRNVSIPDGLAGNHYIHIFTDVRDDVFEGPYEDNNVLSVPVEIMAGHYPDLIVSEINVPEEIIAEESATISWVALNQGEGPAGGSWRDRIYISNNEAYDPRRAQALNTSNRVSVLEADESYYNQVNVDIPSHYSGQYYIHVITDYTNQVYEDGRADNNLTTSNGITVHPKPEGEPSDLAIIESGLPEQINSGEQITISWLVENIGEGVTNVSSWVDRVYLNTQPDLQNASFLKQMNRTSALEPGETYLRQTNINIPNGIDGQYYLIVLLDATSRVNDEDPDNNLLIQPLDVTLAPFADLIVESFEIPEVLYSGQQFTANFTIKNIGEAATNHSWFDRLWISATPDLSKSGSQSVGGQSHNTVMLEPGESYTSSIEVSIPTFVSGNRYLVLSTDDNDRIYEHTGEDNNLFPVLANILVPQPSDLIVDLIEMPENAVTGEDISIAYTVKNIGTNAAIGSLRDAIHLSLDETLDPVIDPIVGFRQQSVNLDPGESQSRTLDTKAPGVVPNDYYGIARTNILASIPESDYANNILTADLTTQVSMHELPVDEVVEADLNAGDKLYYWIDVEANKDMIITLTSNQLSGENEVFVAHEKVPNRVNFDFIHEEPGELNQTVLVPSTFEGKYYINLTTPTDFSSNQRVEIHAELLPFGVHAVSPSNVGQGRVTTLLTGAGFHPDAHVYIADGEGDIVANGQIAEFSNSMQMYVRWELENVPLGTYDLFVTNTEGETESLPQGLTVEEAIPFELAEYAVMPNAIAAGGSAFYSFSYRNISNVDIPYSQVKITFPLGTNLVNFTTSSNTFRITDLIGDEGFDDEIAEQDYFDSDFYRTIPLTSRNLRPDESFSASMVFRRFPEFTFSVLTEQANYTTAEYIQQIAGMSEFLRQYIVNNSDEFQGPDYEAVVSASITEESFRESVFEQYIETGLVDPIDTIGAFEDCLPCDAFLAKLNETDASDYYTFNPGDSPGLEVIDGDETWSSGQSYLWDINRSLYWPEYEGPLGVAGEHPGWDLIEINGTLDINANAISPFTIYMRSLGYNNHRGMLAGWYPAEDVCWPIVVADNITGFNPDKFNVNSYYFQMYNQVHGGSFEVSMSPTADTLYLCFKAYVPGVGEDGVPGAPGVACEPGSPGGKGGPGDGTTPPGQGGRGGDGGDCFADDYDGGNGGAGGSGGDGGFNQDGGAGGDGGDGGYGGPNGSGGDGGPGGEGGEGGTGGDGGPGGNGGTGGTGGDDSSGGDGGSGGRGGTSTAGGTGGNGGSGGGAGAGPASPGDPGPGGPGGLPGGDDGPIGDDPPPCCPEPPNPPTPPTPPGDGPEPPGSPPPPGSDPPPGEGPPPPPPSCCDPKDPDWPDFPDSDPPTGSEPEGTDPFGPAGCGQAPPVSQQDCDDRFFSPDPCASALPDCLKALATSLSRACRFGPAACKIGGALATAQCFIGAAECAADRAGLLDDNKKSHCRPVVRSCDPNDILGPEGYGDERFVSVNDELGYTIRFENDPELAEAPAQVVLITQELNEHINPLSFRLGNFGFADYVFEVPSDRASYNSRLDLRDSLDIYLDVVAGVNVENNQIFWLFTSIDPATGTTPNDPFSGFLEVNDSTGIGEGFVTYSVFANSDSNTGDVIFAEASIIFDVNEAIITPEIFNTIDAGMPVSVMAEPDEVYWTTQIPLSWTAEDDSGGSGVRDFYLYISEDGSPMRRYAGPITDHFYDFTGEPGVEYGFSVRARDNVLNLEPYKSEAEVTTIIDPDLEEYISITQPQVEDVFCPESLITIEWNSFGVNELKIEISADGGSEFHLLADSVSAEDAVYDYIVPEATEPGDQYVIRLVSLENEEVSAQSAVFAVSADDSVPALILNESLTLYLDDNGEAQLSFEMLDEGSYDPCGTFEAYLSVTSFTCNNLGENLVEVIVENESGNTAQQTVSIMVMDNIAPVVMTRDIEVELGESGYVVIEPEAIDDGSFDNCEIADLSIDMDTFDASHLGDNIVQLTVTDSSGNTATAIATVTVSQATLSINLEERFNFKAYPNPFKDVVNFEFLPPENMDISLELYNVKGELIQRVFSGPVKAGQYYRIQFSTNIATGIIFYKLRDGDQVFVGRLIKAQ